VADGETGYLVPPRDPETLAKRVLRLLSDSTLQLRLGRAARDRIKEHYTWERVATLAADAFSEVAASRAYRTS
jgi:D-inositol-3-phosphate glycosyltransferase